MSKIITNLAIFCLENVIIQHKTNFFTQDSGIITGDNHSVSLANITLHYILYPAANIINQAVLFKRFIDDIIWISHGLKITKYIKDTLLNVFDKNNLQLTFRMINTSEENSCLEFLDVEHTVKKNWNSGFYTRDYVKPTALDRTFLNGKSFHPAHQFKSIVFSEAVRLRRLNENHDEYLASLERLRKKKLFITL